MDEAKYTSVRSHFSSETRELIKSDTISDDLIG